ncbi:helix-turn-helix transcriptional regulator [Algicella marina]|uniref:Helix-turn-helix domain-containing protein n=1 Tax=Algicella marina TaxID=2683284 RepID=A0A6P1T3R0_9RHOB|nr:helix-turn-helix transcriptional regulator [Algicella marina]QHQ35162.1 helix-turn-helix domain-containing protein [Algicella marina]
MNQITSTAPEFLTVRELADLLRIKERKVYDLAANGTVPCSRATGKLLFPTAEIRDWIEGAKSGGTTAPTPRPPILLGSHDPLLDWAIRQSRCGLASYFDGSLDGLARFVRGEGIAAGLHIYDGPDDAWNTPAVAAAAADANAVLVTFASRKRGILTYPGGHEPTGIADLAGLTLAPRQAESGTAILFRNLAEKAGLDLTQMKFTEVARTEDEAAQAVGRGEADATFGLETVARTYGLTFLPVLEERFDLLVDRKAWFEPPLQALVTFCRSPAFRERADIIGGYNVADFGTVIWNA